MEGSVSYADGRVAVRAQLIDAKSGVHLWSESYNREFADVFGIQADIAMNIANALEAESRTRNRRASSKFRASLPKPMQPILQFSPEWGARATKARECSRCSIA